MNNKQMEKMMKQMGMQMNEIDAREVIIKCADSQIRIESPQVIIANIMGKKVYQVSGNEKHESLVPKKDDVRMVMEQTGKDEKTVTEKLKELNNDLAKVILELKEE